MAGESHIQDVPEHGACAAGEVGKFEATTDETRLAEMDAISIAVPTPLAKTRDPDMSYVTRRGRRDRAQLPSRAASIVLESTTYPGTTREVMLPKLEARGTRGRRRCLPRLQSRACRSRQPDLEHEEHSEGRRRHHCRRAPRSRPRSTRRASTPSCRSPRTETAELVKLLENTFRSVNIGLVNEMAIVCDKLGVDVWEVIDAAATKPFGFMKFTPGPGIGGHCIPLDPHYLAWKMRTLNYKTRFIDLASEINSEMPAIVVEKGRAGAERREESR